MRSVLKKKPDIIFKNGRPEAVILKIKDYRNILEKLEDKEDLEELERIRKMPLRFKNLDDFLAEYKHSV